MNRLVLHLPNKYIPIFLLLVLQVLVFFPILSFATDKEKSDAPSLNGIFRKNGLFLENKGQLKPYNIKWKDCGDVRYYTQNFSGTAYFADNGIGFGFSRESVDTIRNSSKIFNNRNDEKVEQTQKYNSTSFFLEFVGKNSDAQLTGENKQVALFNYYHGQSHISGAQTYKNISYHNLYPNIDLKYSCEGDGLKFDYILHPDANPEDVKLKYTGAENVSINREGDLEILTEWGVLVDKKPYSYQIINGKERPVEVGFRKNDDGLIGFEVKGDYDKKKNLIIDPYTLTWATYVGGASAGSDGYHYDVTIDNQGNVYGAGWYHPDFPMVNAADNVGNSIEPFVYKMSPDGKTLLFATYCGGNADGDNEIGTGVSVNSAGDVFLCGYTTDATNFPKAGTPVQSTIAGGADIFVARFTSTGALTFTTFYGGPGDDRAYDMDIDASNNIFVTGYTASTTGFATGGAFQTTHGGDVMDAFLLKLNPTGSAVGFCTYYGGALRDLGRGIAVDPTGNVYIGGATESSTGIATAGSFDNTFGGSQTDGFVAKFSNGGARIYGAYVGGTMGDKVEALATKCNGELVVSGWTYSASGSFPSINAIQPENGTGNPIDGGRDGFMCRITADGTKKLNSTFVGGAPDDAAKNGDPFATNNQQHSTSVTVNRLGNIGFCMNTSNQLTVVNPTKATETGIGNGNAYLFITDTAGSKMIFATYFGGNQRDYPTGGIKFHPMNDNIFVLCGNSHSDDGTIQMTAGSYMPLHGSPSGPGQDQPYLVLFTQPVCTLKVSLPAVSPVCKGANITFTADTVCGGKTPSFQWLINGAVVPGATGISYSSNSLNNGDVVCVVFSKPVLTCVTSVDDDTACVTVTINPSPDLSITNASVCSPGTVDITASPGAWTDLNNTTGTTTYWNDAAATSSIASPTAIGTSGTYYIKKTTAGGCSDIKPIIVTIRPLPTATTTQINVLCFGNSTGSVTVAGAGATSPYTYAKDGITFTASGTFSNLGVGNYTITVKDANGCSMTKPVVITQPTALTASETHVNVFCNGAATGSLTVTGANGTGPYTYAKDGITFGASGTFGGLAAGSYTITVKDANSCSITQAVTIAQPTALTATETHVNVLCNGASTGSLTVTGANGTGPYTYAKDGVTFGASGTFVGLTAGSYSITIKDANSCSITQVVTITQPTVLTATATQVNVLCNGGIGSLTVTGANGTAPYTYAKDGVTFGASGTFGSLTAGNYNITVKDANSCSITQAVTITQPAALTGSTTQVNVLCNGSSTGSITATGADGTGPYTYAKDGVTFGASGTFSGLTAGNYTITIKDANSCTIIKPVILTEPSALTLSTTQINILCSTPGSITATGANGTAPYTYSIDGVTFSSGGTFNNLSGGNYIVTVKDANNCTKTKTITITQPAGNLSSSITSQTNIVCFGDLTGSVTVTGVNGTNPYSYSLDGTTFQLSGTFNNLGGGNYSVTVKDANGCIVPQAVTITPAAPLSATDVTVEVLCFGGSTGSVTVSGANGTAPYSYSKDGITFGNSGIFTNLAAGNYTFNIKDAHNCSTTHPATITQPTVLTASATQTNVSCFGGSNGMTTVIGSGGTAPYTYAKDGVTFSNNGTFTSLTAGNYSLTVKDANNCSVIQTVTITQPPALAATVASVNVDCFGNASGSVTVSASGGTGPYTFSKDAITFLANGTFTNLTAANYSFTIKDANSCVTTKAVSITEPLQLSAITSKTDVDCLGNASGSVTVTAANGTGPYSYSIDGFTFGASSTFSNLTASTYTLTVKDAKNCITSQNVTVNQPTALSATLSAQTNVDCFGNATGSLTVTASNGTAPYTFSINNTSFAVSGSFTGLTAGNYTVTVKDANGCVALQPATITEPFALSLALTSTPVKCFGDASGAITALATSGTGPYTYSIDGTVFSTNGTFNGLIAGNYTITTKDAHACVATKSTTVAQPTSLTASVVSQTAVSCSVPGNATVVANGGVSPYVYSIDNLTFGSSGTFNNLSPQNYTITIRDSNNCTASQNVTIGQTPGGLSASITSQINVNCFGNTNGEVTVEGSNGQAPYVYSIDGTNFTASGTFSNLGGGNYTVTVKDINSCQYPQAVTITPPAALATNSKQSNVLCNGGSTGSITLTSTGGTPAYSYSIDNINFGPGSGFNNLSAGNYTITVKDANSCATTQPVTITEPLALSESLVKTDVLCFGIASGSIVATATDGTTPYRYSIDNATFSVNGTFSNLVAGNYIVTINDSNNCSISEPVTLTEPNALSVLSVQKNIDCFGNSNGSTTVTASNGTAPYLYSIDGVIFGASPGFTSMLAGNYTLTVKDAHQCVINHPLSITQPKALTASVSLNNVTCFSTATGSAIITAADGTGPYTYSLDGTTYSAVNTLNNLPKASYVAKVKDANGCPFDAPFNITEPEALSSNALPKDVLCNGGSDAMITVTGIKGTSPYLYSIDKVSFQSNGTFQNLTPGSYDVIVKDANGCTNTRSVSVSQPAIALVASIPSKTNIDCFGIPSGSFNVSASGGTLPYLYSLDGLSYTSASFFGSLAAGNYSAFVKDANNCPANAPVTLTEPLVLVLDIVSKKDIICKTPGSITVQASNGTAPYSYWINGVNKGSNLTFANLDTGIYTIMVKDIKGCASSRDTSIKPYLSVPPVISANQALEACYDQTVILTSDKPTGNVWSPNGETTQSILVDHSGTFFVTVSDSLLCPLPSKPLTIVIKPKPETKVGLSGDICAGASTLIGSDAIAGYAYTWTSIPPDFSSHQAKASVQPARDTQYKLTATYNNCSASDSIMITVKGDPALYIPNAFTPNDDGLNDVFKVKTDQVIEFKGLIFDRWGANIFEWNNVDQGWDGKVKGDDRQIDVYVYIINAKGKCSDTIKKMGTVTLVR